MITRNKQRVNITISFEAYKFLRERDYNISELCSTYLEKRMLAELDMTEMVDNKEKLTEDLQKLDEKTSKNLTKMAKMRQKLTEIAQKQTEKIAIKEKNLLLNSQSLEEIQYWQKTIEVMNRNPELKSGRINFYKNLFDNNISEEIWMEKYERVKNEQLRRL